MRETEIVPSAVELELRTEDLLGHRRAFDVPPRSPRAPRRSPRRVLVRLLGLPKGEVPLVLLEVTRLLGDHLLQSGAREPPVLRKARNAEIHIPIHDVRVLPIDELLNKPNDLGNRLGGPWLEIRSSQPEVVRILEEPGCRALRQLPARNS